MDMGGMDMHGFRMEATPFGAVLIPTLRPWSAPEFVFAFVMWAVMMIGMMLPSAAPMVLLYARVGRQAALQGKPLAATGYFATGYLAVWIGFSFFATAGQWTLERAALLSPAMASTSTVLGGLVLIAAGLFQWTPAKNVCLSYCQSPFMFLQRYGGFRRDAVGSLSIGFRHGLYCVGCCWALMALLFVGGIMNVLWIALLAILVLVEKVFARGQLISRIAGVALAAEGIWLIGSVVL
jgi:predicted metal-binding membrane protein